MPCFLFYVFLLLLFTVILEVLVKKNRMAFDWATSVELSPSLRTALDNLLLVNPQPQPTLYWFTFLCTKEHYSMYICSSCTELAEENRFMCMTLPWSFKAGEHSVIWFPTDGVSPFMELIRRPCNFSMYVHTAAAYRITMSESESKLIIEMPVRFHPEIKRCCPILWAFTNTVCIYSPIPHTWRQC